MRSRDNLLTPDGEGPPDEGLTVGAAPQRRPSAIVFAPIPTSYQEGSGWQPHQRRANGGGGGDSVRSFTQSGSASTSKLPTAVAASSSSVVGGGGGGNSSSRRQSRGPFGIGATAALSNDDDDEVSSQHAYGIVSQRVSIVDALATDASAPPTAVFAPQPLASLSVAALNQTAPASGTSMGHQHSSTAATSRVYHGRALQQHHHQSSAASIIGASSLVSPRNTSLPAFSTPPTPSALPLYVSAASGAHVLRPLLIVMPPAAAALFSLMEAEEGEGEDIRGYIGACAAAAEQLQNNSFGEGGGGGGGGQQYGGGVALSFNTRLTSVAALDALCAAPLTVNLLPVTALEVAGEGGGIRMAGASGVLSRGLSPALTPRGGADVPINPTLQQQAATGSGGMSGAAEPYAMLQSMLDASGLARSPHIGARNAAAALAATSSSAGEGAQAVPAGGVSSPIARQKQLALQQMRSGAGQAGGGGGEITGEQHQQGDDGRPLRLLLPPATAKRNVIVVSPLTKQLHVLGGVSAEGADQPSTNQQQQPQQRAIDFSSPTSMSAFPETSAFALASYSHNESSSATNPLAPPSAATATATGRRSGGGEWPRGGAAADASEAEFELSRPQTSATEDDTEGGNAATTPANGAGADLMFSPPIAAPSSFLFLRSVGPETVDRPSFEAFTHVLLTLPGAALPLLSWFLISIFTGVCVAVMLPSLGVYAHRWLSGPNRFGANLKLETVPNNTNTDDVAALTILLGANALAQCVVLAVICWRHVRYVGPNAWLLRRAAATSAADSGGGGTGSPSSAATVAVAASLPSSLPSHKLAVIEGKKGRLVLITFAAVSAFGFVTCLNLFLGLETARRRANGAVDAIIGMGLPSYEASVGVCWCVTAFIFVLLMLLATIV